MQKEFGMMLIVIVCTILGVICAAITNVLFTQGIINNSIIWNVITISNFEFIIVLAWLVTGIIIGVMKD